MGRGNGATSARVRAGLGISQVELASLVGVAPMTVSKWERGISRPRPYQAMLLEAFDRASTRSAPFTFSVSDCLVQLGVLATVCGLLEVARRTPEGLPQHRVPDPGSGPR